MRYEEKPQITEQEIREAMDFSTAQVKRNLPEFTTKFQKAYSENGFYAPTDNVDWTTGFWTGEIWLSYEDTGKDIYKKAGEIQIDSFLNRIENKIEVDHHDMGFLYSPSCVAGYKLTGNETGRKAAILAADQLIRRFQPVGNFIQAWGAMDAPENYRLIIDCLLNLPLLYWASEETGDPKYRDIAEKHIHTEPPVRDTATVRRGREARHGASTGWRSPTSTRKGKNTFRSSGMSRTFSWRICPRIWCRSGIWSSRTGTISREIPPRRRSQHAECLRWQNI